jgi:hypothetical protein
LASSLPPEKLVKYGHDDIEGDQTDNDPFQDRRVTMFLLIGQHLKPFMNGFELFGRNLCALPYFQIPYRKALESFIFRVFPKNPEC